MSQRHLNPSLQSVTIRPYPKRAHHPNSILPLCNQTTNEVPISLHQFFPKPSYVYSQCLTETPIFFDTILLLPELNIKTQTPQLPPPPPRLSCHRAMPQAPQNDISTHHIDASTRI